MIRTFKKCIPLPSEFLTCDAFLKILLQHPKIDATPLKKINFFQIIFKVMRYSTVTIKSLQQDMLVSHPILVPHLMLQLCLQGLCLAQHLQQNFPYLNFLPCQSHRTPPPHHHYLQKCHISTTIGFKIPQRLVQPSLLLQSFFLKVEASNIKLRQSREKLTGISVYCFKLPLSFNWLRIITIVSQKTTGNFQEKQNLYVWHVYDDPTCVR